jgi:serine/threonine-protein kinase RsbW
VIRVKLPGQLEYRDLAVRTVASACKLVEARRVNPVTGASRPDADFDGEVVSAFSEAFNNVALHGYEENEGELEIEIETLPDRLTIRLKDFGKGFDIAAVPIPDLDSLPESGLGLFIIRACMDDVTYVPGQPNVLSMTKYLVHEEVAGEAAGD